MAKILIAEDDLEFAALVQRWLTDKRHTVDVAHAGSRANDLIEAFPFDLLILDWDLPEMTGVDICRKLRAKSIATPVLMLTGKATVDDKEQGFGAGADDYLTKPVDLRELGLRVTALLRRAPHLLADVLEKGDLSLCTRSRSAKKGTRAITLLPREFTLLEYLLKHKGRMFSAEQLLDAVWSSDTEASPHTVRSCVNRIRDKVDTKGRPSIIRTEYSVGYTVDE